MGTLILIDDEAPVSCELTDTAFIDEFTESSYSIDLDFGDLSAGLTAIAVVSYLTFDDADVEVTAATIGGINAEILSQADFTPSSGTGAGVAIIAAPDAGGGTLTVTVTASDPIMPFFGAFRALNVLSLVPTDTAGNSGNPSGGSLSTQIDTVDGGLLIAGAAMRHEGTVEISAGVTEDYNLVNNAVWHALGGHLLTSAQTGRTITVQRASGAASIGATAIAAVSLR